MRSYFLLQTLWASCESDFAAAAMAAGLMERVEDAEFGRPNADRGRCVHLASARFAAQSSNPEFSDSLLRQPSPVATVGEAEKCCLIEIMDLKFYLKFWFQF